MDSCHASNLKMLPEALPEQMRYVGQHRPLVLYSFCVMPSEAFMFSFPILRSQPLTNTSCAASCRCVSCPVPLSKVYRQLALKIAEIPLIVERGKKFR